MPRRRLRGPGSHLYFKAVSLPVSFFPNTVYDPIRLDELPLNELDDVYLLDFVGPSGFVREISSRVKRKMFGGENNNPMFPVFPLMSTTYSITPMHQHCCNSLETVRPSSGENEPYLFWTLVYLFLVMLSFSSFIVTVVCA